MEHHKWVSWEKDFVGAISESTPVGKSRAAVQLRRSTPSPLLGKLWSWDGPSELPSLRDGN